MNHLSRSDHVASKIFRELSDMNDNGETPVRVQSYSGRAMYGRKCVGLVADYMGDIFGGLTRAARFVSESEDFTASEVLDTLAEIFADTRMDNMGLGMVVYFPSVSADVLRDEVDEELDEKDSDNDEDDEE